MQAMKVWENIDQCIKAYNAENLHPYPLSVSHGFAEYDPLKPVSVSALINKADAEMYARKRLYKLSLERKES